MTLGNRKEIFDSPCGEIPEKLSDLEGKKYLTVHDIQGQAYEGTFLRLECVDIYWELTVNLFAGGTKSFKSDEVSSVTRHA